MALDNKLGLEDAVALAHEEEWLTKKRALELYDKKYWTALRWGLLRD